MVKARSTRAMNSQGRKKTRIHNFSYGPRCSLYGFVDYFWKGTESFDVLTGDPELEVRTSTHGPEIDQSPHAKISQPNNIEQACCCKSIHLSHISTCIASQLVMSANIRTTFYISGSL